MYGHHQGGVAPDTFEYTLNGPTLRWLYYLADGVTRNTPLLFALFSALPATPSNDARTTDSKRCFEKTLSASLGSGTPASTSSFILRTSTLLTAWSALPKLWPYCTTWLWSTGGSVTSLGGASGAHLASLVRRPLCWRPPVLRPRRLRPRRATAQLPAEVRVDRTRAAVARETMAAEGAKGSCGIQLGFLRHVSCIPRGRDQGTQKGELRE